MYVCVRAYTYIIWICVCEYIHHKYVCVRACNMRVCVTCVCEWVSEWVSEWVHMRIFVYVVMWWCGGGGGGEGRGGEGGGGEGVCVCVCVCVCQFEMNTIESIFSVSNFTVPTAGIPGSRLRFRISRGRWIGLPGGASQCGGSSIAGQAWRLFYRLQFLSVMTNMYIIQTYIDEGPVQ